MNNIKKAFKDKSRLRRMADGGYIDPKTQLGVLGGAKDVGPGAGVKGTDTIFKSTVDGVPTFSDRSGMAAGAKPYTQNAAQPMGNFVTNQAGRTATPEAPVVGAVPPAFVDAKAGGRAGALSAPAPVAPAAPAAPAAPSPAGNPRAVEMLTHKANAPASTTLSPSTLRAAALMQSPYEKMNGLAAGSRSTPESNVPSWVRGPMSGGLRPGGLDPNIIANAAKFDQPADTRPMWQRAPKMDISMTSPVANGQFGNVGQPQTAPAPMWQRQPMQDVGMDYISKTGGYGPTKKPEPVVQMADGGRVPPAGYYDISSSAGRKEFEAAYRRGEKPQVWDPPKSDFEQALQDRFINRMTQSIGVPLVIDALVGKDNDAIMQRREALKTAAKTTAAQNAGQLALRAVAPRLAPLAGPVGAAAALSYQINQELKPGGALRRPEHPVSIYFPDTGQRFPPRSGPVRGPGGPTDDKVPAMLSDGEYVLPADTVKAVGVDKLNALRDATHTPTGKAKYQQGLRRYNDGDLVIDPRKQMVPVGQPGRIEIPGTQRAARAAAQAAAEAPIPANRAIVPYKEPLLSSARLGALSRLGGGVGAVMEGYSTLKDVATPGMSTVDNVARVSEGVGRVAGAGTGAVIGSALGPFGTVVGGTAGYFMPEAASWVGRKLGVLDDTAELPSARASRLRTENFQQAIADENARNEVASMPEPRKYIVGSAETPAATARTDTLNDLQQEALGAARSTLSSRGGSAPYAQVPRNEREINKRYDKLGRELRGMYSSKGQGNLARKLLELEEARGRELGFDQRSAVDVAGMNTQSASALRSQENQARIQAAGDLSSLGNTQAMNASNALLAQSRVDAAGIEALAKAGSDAAKAAAKAEKDGEVRYNKAIDEVFGEDAEGADKFRRFVAASDPKFVNAATGDRDLYSLGPAEMAKAIHQLRKLYEIQDVRNAYSDNSLVGYDYGVSTGSDAMTGLRNVRLNDFFNGNASFTDAALKPLANWVPFVDPFDTTMVEFQSGAIAPRSKVVTTRGKTDADKERMLYDAVNRSKLRNQ